MYYPVDLSIVEGEVLNDGRKAMDVLRDLPGIREASWGGIYLPEETLEIEEDPFLAWLYLKTKQKLISQMPGMRPGNGSGSGQGPGRRRLLPHWNSRMYWRCKSCY